MQRVDPEAAHCECAQWRSLGADPDSVKPHSPTIASALFGQTRCLEDFLRCISAVGNPGGSHLLSGTTIALDLLILTFLPTHARMLFSVPRSVPAVQRRAGPLPAARLIGAARERSDLCRQVAATAPLVESVLRYTCCRTTVCRGVSPAAGRPPVCLLLLPSMSGVADSLLGRKGECCGLMRQVSQHCRSVEEVLWSWVLLGFDRRMRKSRSVSIDVILAVMEQVISDPFHYTKTASSSCVGMAQACRSASPRSTAWQARTATGCNTRLLDFLGALISLP